MCIAFRIECEALMTGQQGAGVDAVQVDRVGAFAEIGNHNALRGGIMRRLE